MNKIRNGLLFVLSLVVPLSVAAVEDAGRIEKRFEKPIEPKSTSQPLIFPINEKLPPEKAAELRFTLKEIVIKGNTAFTTEQLAPLYADLIGREVTLLDIYKLRDAITAKYGNAGYGLSKAIIPEQRIESNGIVHLEIIEGFIDEVIIEGATGQQQSYMAYAIEKFKAQRPLKVKTLERYLLLANDKFSIKVTSTMKASDKTPAASTLILKIEQPPKLSGGISVDNRGTPDVGPNQINANLVINGINDSTSQTTLNYATTEQQSELQYVALSHIGVLNDEGTTLTVGLSDSTSKPGSPALRLLANRSDSQTWSLQLAHPFIRTRQENLSTHVKFEHKNISGQSLGIFTLRDNIRSLRLGLNYDNADAANGVNQALLEYSIGINDFGASPTTNPLKSRADGKPDYQKLTLNISRNQQLEYFSPSLSKFSLNAAMMGQYSASGLLSSEECGIGGLQFGRAFDSSEILGDSCLAASLELRYMPDTSGTVFQNTQLYGFYEGGTTTNVTPLSAIDPKTKSLASTGLGVRFGLWQHLSGSLEVAQPLGRIVANQGNKNARVFASLSARF